MSSSKFLIFQGRLIHKKKDSDKLPLSLPRMRTATKPFSYIISYFPNLWYNVIVMKSKKEHALSIINHARPILLLEGWEIEVDIKNKDKDITIQATCTPLPSYRSVHITIYPNFFKETQQQQHSIILHELIHVIIEPYSKLVTNLLDGKLVTAKQEEDLNEQITSWLTQIISNLYAKEKTLPKT